jgi:retron-type reverse transcriptase
MLRNPSVTWHIIKDDVMKAIKLLENAGTQGLHLLNNALMVLLPKSSEAVSPGDFRPISLVHSFGKLFTKILAKRLQPQMSDLVAPCQNAFIRGRSIHDNFVYVQGVVHSLRKKKIPSLMMKLDISKAFDSVSWEFLLKLLARRGFDNKWISWIVSLLHSSSTKIMVNGDLTDHIYHMRGLRQGDHVSPLLFVLVMDCLGRLIDKAQNDLLLPQIGNQILRFRTSMYADDVVIFLRPNLNDLQVTMAILRLFGTATGLHTNLNKSSIIPIACSLNEVTMLTAAVECKMEQFPCQYLGLPLSDKRLKRADF